MLFEYKDIQRLLEIVDYHSSFLIGDVLGKEMLSDYDRFILNKHGIDPDKLTEGKDTTYFHMYMWGKLSSLLQGDAKNVTFEDFEKYIKRGQYIPLNKFEQRQLDISKQKTYGHLKGLGERIKQTVNGIIVEQDLSKKKQYEEVTSGKISEGVLKRQTVGGIISEIGNKLGDWHRDWGRIVETEYNDIFQQGIADEISSKDGIDSLVFKDVYDGACRFCISFYLKNGIGSEPVTFKLSELIANGSNVGRKQVDWKPVVGSTHPFCRCSLRKLPDGYSWDEEAKLFKPQKVEKELKYKRKSKIEIIVGDSVFYR